MANWPMSFWRAKGFAESGKTDSFLLYDPDFKIMKRPTAPKPWVYKVLALADAMGVPVAHDRCDAYYDDKPDIIVLPEPTHFRDWACYANVVAHELIHATGHQDRLARESAIAYTTDWEIAIEEATAEMGATLVTLALGGTALPYYASDRFVAKYLPALPKTHWYPCWYHAEKRAVEAARYLTLS